MDLMIGYSIRPFGEVQDSAHVMNIDQKSTEYPYDFQDWQSLNMIPDWYGFICTHKETPCGFVLYELLDCLRIHRLAVLPEYRRHGVGITLLHLAEENARLKQVKLFEFPVPETSCRGGNDPYDMSKWLNLQNYRCEEIQEAMFNGYGKDIDGYIFRKRIP